MAPPNNTQLPSNEGRIALAVQAIKQGQFSSVRAAAQAFDISKSTLSRRVKGVDARRDSTPINRKLTPTEESTLVEWILSSDQRGLPVRGDYIRQMANLLLQKRSQDNTLIVGKNWVYNFVQRHDSLESKYTRKYDYQRAKCEDPTIIRD
jgi:transposase